MTSEAPDFTVGFAQTEADINAALALRYDVFVRELGGTGEGVDHHREIERDRFDEHASHLILKDRGRVVGLYRLMDAAQAAAAGGFYSSAEFDLGVLLASGRNILELGRSCLHPEYRGGQAMFQLWTALSRHVLETQTEILFGTASFHGTDAAGLAGSLALLYHRHLAPDPLRVRAIGPTALRMNTLAENEIDRRSAMLAVPPLIKAYLRLGGYVGDGAYVDYQFNTTDVLLILDTARMNAAQRTIYENGGRA